MSYIERNSCIFCNNPLYNNYFNDNYIAYPGHYSTDNEYDSIQNSIPFNITICNNCNTSQLKFLGTLDEVYKYNHADSTGTIMHSLHEKIVNMLEENIDEINNIIEVGSSYGILSDMVLTKNNLKYYIIEPNYMGNINNKIIYNDYYENIDDTKIDANTLVISHVFEHFYNPKEILNKIYKNKNIINFILVFPDLEYYINNNVYHVLNTEHTYYVDNNFIINELDNIGFSLKEKYYHKNHSVIFYFKRTTFIRKDVIYKNINYSLHNYYNDIFEKVNRYNEIINNNAVVYAWPASIHTLYLCIFGLNYKKMKGLLDNSINKIGKYINGISLPIYPFSILNSINEDVYILLNGSIFTSELDISKYPKNIKFIN